MTIIDIDELIRKIEIHIEVTQDSMENFGVPLWVTRLLDDDNDLFKEIIIKLKKIKDNEN
jgi:hypothetical protein